MIASSADRAAKVFSTLQSSMHLDGPISALSAEASSALRAAIAELLSRGTHEGTAMDVVRLVGKQVPGFAAAWIRFEAEGHAAPRLVLGRLARGEYSSG